MQATRPEPHLTARRTLPGVSAGLRMVSGVEQDIRRLKELLAASGIRILEPAEWGELSGLIASIQKHLTLLDDRWGHRPGRLPESGAMGPWADEAFDELLRRLAWALNYVYSATMPWEDRIRRIELHVPGRSAPVVVESRIVPGTALGAGLGSGYPAEELSNPDGSARFRHVPDLEQTVLTGADGDLLYSGLRHSFIQASDLDGLQLNRLPDDELRVLLQDLYKPEYRGFPGFRAPIRMDTDFILSEIRNHSSAANIHAVELSDRARRKMVRESFAAALVTDTGKFQRALGGATVELPLFVIALVDDSSTRSAINQSAAYFHSTLCTSLELRARDPSGNQHTVNAKVDVRDFVFSMEGPGALLTWMERAKAVRLLGPIAAEEPGGAVKEQTHVMLERVGKLKEDIRKLGTKQLQTVRRRGVDHPEALSAAHRLIELTTELSRLERNARTLQQAARQLKTLLLECGETPVGTDKHHATAARLALIAHLMGATPVLSCPSGSGFARELDTETKFLATVADCRDGSLPPIGRDRGVWDDARGAFTPH